MSVRGIGVLIALALFIVAPFVEPPAVDANDSNKGSKKEWVVTALPHLSGWYGSYANDISGNGLIGGGWVDEYGVPHAAYWKKGKAYDLEVEIGLPTGMTDSVAVSINSSGLMGGNAWEMLYGTQVAVLWDTKKGKLTNLHPGDDYIASALYGVNERGDATGFVVDVETYAYTPWVWPKGDSTGEALPLGDFATGVSLGINSSGAISGYAEVEPFGEVHAVVWMKTKKGEYELYDLHESIVDDDDSIGNSLAIDIGENGTVVGQAIDGDGIVHAFRWTLSGGLDLLDADDEERAIAWKTASNYVAGGIGEKVGAYGSSSTDAAVWVKGELEVLPALEDFPVMETSSVNSKGAAVGFGFADDDEYLIYAQGWYAEKK